MVVLFKEIIYLILLECDKKTLHQFSRVSKEYNKYITQDNSVLRATVFWTTAYEQFLKWMEVGRTFYGSDVYTDIGQMDNAKYPYLRRETITKINKGPNNPSYESKGDNFTRSSKLDSHILSYHNVKTITLEQGILMILKMITEMLTEKNLLDFVQKNIKIARQRIKKQVLANPDLKRLMYKHFSKEEWFVNYMKEKDHEYRSSSDEEANVKREQNILDDMVGKNVVYTCKRCGIVMAGFTCCKVKAPQSTHCETLLLLRKNGNAYCPKNCGEIKPPICCRKRMIASHDPSLQIVANKGQTRNTDESCPVLSCENCTFALDGINCYKCEKQGSRVQRNGFFERVWCAYVWTCPNSCGRKERGGTLASNMMECMCSPTDTTMLSIAQYEAIHGPPMN